VMLQECAYGLFEFANAAVNTSARGIQLLFPDNVTRVLD
jgi:hypothetical protein